MGLRLMVVINAVIYLLSTLVSYASNAGFFKGRTIGEVSDKYISLFVPAGFTFSIWGIIYTALYAFMVYHLIHAFRKDYHDRANRDFRAVGWLFMITNFAASLWVITWINEQLAASIVLMLIQLVCLTLINIRLGIYDPARSRGSKVFTQFPLTIYFAWICIATIANVSSALVGLGWNADPGEASSWTIVLIVFAAFLTLFITFRRRNIFFPLVVIWAFYGIANKETDGIEISSAVENACWVSIVLLAISLAVQLSSNRKNKGRKLNYST